MAATTSLKSRATRTSGSDEMKSEKLRLAERGGEANSLAATLFGRRSIGTVRILDRSASGVLEAGPFAFPPDRGARGPRLPPSDSAMGNRI
jgi:hypothetical protein